MLVTMAVDVHKCGGSSRGVGWENAWKILDQYIRKGNGGRRISTGISGLHG